MIHICPTVTAANPHEYREELERIQPFAKRIHIDFADNAFTPVELLAPVQAWMPEDMEVDFHVMLMHPAEELKTLVALQPSLIVFHAESQGDLPGILREVQMMGIRAGVALLQDTQPETHKELIQIADHALIFGGKLGYHGGTADLQQLQKISQITSYKEAIEIGWDGGINDENIHELVHSGVTVCNVGGFIQKSEDPQAAYGILNAINNSSNETH